MSGKQQDVLAILKLYELRRDDELRAARAWYLGEFNPGSAQEIAAMMLSGEGPSARFRMVVSYWDMAASLVNNGGIDEKLFLEANTEHVVVFAKIEPFLAELREMFAEPEYLGHLERLVRKVPNVEERLVKMRGFLQRWTKAAGAGPS
ncbi:MAG: hypothetical protein K1Y36_02555 [Blastocatellia bacterium]|nr:hypothetical protein [Blastocatellia bacterium]